MSRFLARPRSFVYGFTLSLQAAKTIFSHPSLILWALLPLALTLFLYVYAIQGAQQWAQDHMAAFFAARGWDLQGWAYWGVNLLGKLLLFVAGALTFTFASSLVASPFNDLLAEAAERWAEPPLPPTLKTTLMDKVRLIAIDMGKTLAAAAAAVAALVLSWVPFVNVVAFGVTFLLVCFQFTSYPQTRRGVTVKQGVAFLWRHVFACAGLGAVLTFLFAVPFLSSFMLPIAVVAGTLLVARAPGGAGVPPLK